MISRIDNLFFHDDFEKRSYKYYAPEQCSLSPEKLTTDFDAEFLIIIKNLIITTHTNLYITLILNNYLLIPLVCLTRAK